MNMRTEEIERLFHINQSILKTNTPKLRNKNLFCVTRDGKEICYMAPNQIDTKLDDLMDTVFALCQRSEQCDSLLKSLAVFWLGFVEIHPFEDGNLRTAKEYIRHKLDTAHLPVISLRPLERVKLVGDIKVDLDTVEQALFECIYR